MTHGKIALCLMALATACLMAAQSVTITSDMLTFGPKAPKTLTEDGSAWSFQAEPKDSTAALLKQTFDFTKGARVELEFQDSKKQSNPFPRLLQHNSFSLHLVCNVEDTVGRIVKILMTDPKGQYCQAQLTYLYQEGAWHKLVCIYSPKDECVSLQLDDQEPAVEHLSVQPPMSGLSFILGSGSMKASNRGYSGAIRNLRIATGAEAGTGISAQAVAKSKPAQEREGIEYHIVADFPNRHLAFPGIDILPNGDWAVVYREGDAHVCPYGRVCLTFSKDEGLNWSSPMAVDDTPTDDRDPSIHTLPDGRILITHGGWNSWMAYAATRDKFPGASAFIEQSGMKTFNDARFVFSNDNGVTWEKAITTSVFCPHGPCVGPDGCFYQPVLGYENGGRQVFFFKGTPDAQRWERIAQVCAVDAQEPAKYEEPHSIFLPDGTIATAIRVPFDGYMRMSFSKDMGKTWSEPIKTNVKGFPQNLLQLSDGRLLVVYGYRYPGLGVRACLSTDGGHTWDMEHEIVIRSHGCNGDLGYPVARELPDGRVVVVYYYNTLEHPMPFIEVAVLKP